MKVTLAEAHVTLKAPHGAPSLPLAKALIVATQTYGGAEITQTFLATAQLQRSFDPAPIRRLVWVVGFHFARLVNGAGPEARRQLPGRTEGFVIVDAHEQEVLAAV